MRDYLSSPPKYCHFVLQGQWKIKKKKTLLERHLHCVVGGVKQAGFLHKTYKVYQSKLYEM